MIWRARLYAVSRSLFALAVDLLGDVLEVEG